MKIILGIIKINISLFLRYSLFDTFLIVEILLICEYINLKNYS